MDMSIKNLYRTAIGVILTSVHVVAKLYTLVGYTL